MEIGRAAFRWVRANWERILFAGFGLLCLGACFRLVCLDRMMEAAVLFVLGLLGFFYANVSRFKRIKGWGFEAELWEDKKKEAADLIERLREVVSIYTRELILGKVRANRMAGGPKWIDRWKLYNDLVDQHKTLG